MNREDYIPKEESKLVQWNTNFISKFPMYSNTLGINTEEIGLIVNSVNNITNKISAVNLKQKEMLELIATKNAVKEAELNMIRELVERIKISKNYTESIGLALGIVGKGRPKGESPTIKRAETDPSGTSVYFQKNGFTGVNIYRAKAGETDFIKLNYASSSPFLDDTLAKNEVAKYQYKIIGVEKNHEEGQFSNMIEVLVG